MSVRWMRTGQIANGRFMEALAWAKETAVYVEKKHGTPKVRVWIDTSGLVGAIRWTMDLPDLAAVEKAQTQLMMDPDYWKMLHKAMDAKLFIDGTTVDTLSREV